MTKYKILLVTGEDIRDVVTEMEFIVAEHIACGWKLQGGISFVYDPEPGAISGGYTLMQVMVEEETVTSAIITTGRDGRLCRR